MVAYEEVIRTNAANDGCCWHCFASPRLFKGAVFFFLQCNVVFVRGKSYAFFEAHLFALVFGSYGLHSMHCLSCVLSCNLLISKLHPCLLLCLHAFF